MVFRIPAESSRTSDLIAKFRNTKLAALQTSPSEWLYQYASESKHPLSVWESRFADKNTILVCVATRDANLPAEEALIQGEWVGFTAIRGPFTYEEYYPSPAMEQPIPANPSAETRWHLFDLYTFPTYRGRGIARKLIAAALGTSTVQATQISGSSSSGSHERARVRLFVNPKNVPLVDTYKRLGFEPSGKPNLRDGLLANGMVESIPDEATMGPGEWTKKFNTRFGLAMEKVIDVP